MNQKLTCVAPFSSLYITGTGVANPCCVFHGGEKKFIKFDKDLKTNFDQINQPYRQDFLDPNWSLENYFSCRVCNMPGTTQRHLHNNSADPNIDYVQNPTLTNLHLKFSNLCNLACRMCDGFSSNLILNEKDTDLAGTNPDKNNVITNISRDSVFYKSILDNLKNLRYLWFSGGETLLHDQVWEIIRELYRQNLSQNITLHINTNGTVKLTDEEIQMLKSFKGLNFHVSVDGIGKLTEYIRTNMVWDKWLENFKVYYDEFSSNADFAVVTTISTFNVHKVTEIKKFFRENFRLTPSLNYVYGRREELAAFNINDRAKQYLYDLYTSNKDDDREKIFKYLENPRTLDPARIADIIDARDNRIIENSFHKNYVAFRNVDPEWYELLRS